MIGLTSVAAFSMRDAYLSSMSGQNVTSSGMRSSIPASSRFATTAGMSSSYYQFALPRNLDIFTEVDLGLRSPAITGDQRRLGRKLVAELKANLLRNYQQKYMDLPYSELHYYELDGSAVLIEWTYLNLRAGFSIENNLADSSYYILIRDKEDGVSTVVPEYGPLNEENVCAVASRVVARVSEKL